jgi:hypothetical protein
MIIEITHQEDKKNYKFKVINDSKLTPLEVKEICSSMNVKAILVNGKYYEI